MSTLPHKSSRPIQINGRSYRWMVTNRQTFLRLTVRDELTGEIKQHEYAKSRDIDDYGDTIYGIEALTPREVREFIISSFLVT